ncbi:unnamed protein product [Clonostachys rhizophaga]|uniref:Uncharacterized protein n=1 Tax=Clonostachys rhizophaga TaxID=160324 RepID=A0A9N9YD46_9HYPO|nr:unnamed protein product [Clonostachys rhizophaga]
MVAAGSKEVACSDLQRSDQCRRSDQEVWGAKWNDDGGGAFDAWWVKREVDGAQAHLSLGCDYSRMQPGGRHITGGVGAVLANLAVGALPYRSQSEDLLCAARTSLHAMPPNARPSAF